MPLAKGDEQSVDLMDVLATRLPVAGRQLLRSGDGAEEEEKPNDAAPEQMRTRTECHSACPSGLVYLPVFSFGARCAGEETAATMIAAARKPRNCHPLKRIANTIGARWENKR
jgi:hypothetical protein